MMDRHVAAFEDDHTSVDTEHLLLTMYDELGNTPSP